MHQTSALLWWVDTAYRTGKWSVSQVLLKRSCWSTTVTLLMSETIARSTGWFPRSSHPLVRAALQRTLSPFHAKKQWFCSLLGVTCIRVPCGRLYLNSFCPCTVVSRLKNREVLALPYSEFKNNNNNNSLATGAPALTACSSTTQPLFWVLWATWRVPGGAFRSPEEPGAHRTRTGSALPACRGKHSYLTPILNLGNETVHPIAGSNQMYLYI